MNSNSIRLESLLKIGHELNYSENLDTVLDDILLNARSLTCAEAGTIYLRQGNILNFEITQNRKLFTSNLDNKNNYENQKIPINEHSIAGFTALNSNNDDDIKILNISDVYSLSHTYPFGFDESFDRENDYRTRSMLVAPINNASGLNIGVIQLINRKDDTQNTIPFDTDDELVISAFSDIASVHIERAQITKEMILRMIKMAELRDPKETGPHVNRVGAYSAELYEHWALKHSVPEKEIKKIKGDYRLASMLHDVGKVGISDIILKKPGPFTIEERKIMQQHTIFGTRLYQSSVSSIDILASAISLSHHENWDGSGYPGDAENRGLKGNDIPLSGRIVKITDVYDALMTERCYKKAWSEQKVLDEIEKNRGIEFDSELVDCFTEIYDTIKVISVKYDEGEG